MNRVRLVFYTVLIAIIPISVVSCLQDNGRLREAELLMETDPKEADSILVSMTEPTSRRDRTWYVVLKSLADCKNDRIITSDSLIRKANSAIYAFLKAKDLFPVFLVHYYALTEYKLGTRYQNMKMYNQAMVQLMSTGSVRLIPNSLPCSVNLNVIERL